MHVVHSYKETRTPDAADFLLKSYVSQKHKQFLCLKKNKSDQNFIIGGRHQLYLGFTKCTRVHVLES